MVKQEHLLSSSALLWPLASLACWLLSPSVRDAWESIVAHLHWFLDGRAAFTLGEVAAFLSRASLESSGTSHPPGSRLVAQEDPGLHAHTVDTELGERLPESLGGQEKMQSPCISARLAPLCWFWPVRASGMPDDASVSTVRLI